MFRFGQAPPLLTLAGTLTSRADDGYSDNSGFNVCCWVILILIGGFVLLRFGPRMARWSSEQAAETRAAQRRAAAEAEEVERRAVDEARQAKDARIRDEVERWLAARSGKVRRGVRPPPASVELPPGIRPPGLPSSVPWLPGDRSTHRPGADVEMPSGTRVHLPDPDQAREEIHAVMSGLARGVRAEAHAHGEAVRSLADDGLEIGRYRLPEGYRRWGPAHQGYRLTRPAADRVEAVFAWAKARRKLFARVHQDAAVVLLTLGPLEEELHRYRDDPNVVGDGGDVPVLPLDRWTDFLHRLHHAVTTAESTLSVTKVPPLLPALHPPGFARLKDHVVAETVEERLAVFVEQCSALRTAALSGEWPAVFGARWDLGASLLNEFLTTEVLERFEAVTKGFRQVARWTGKDITPAGRSVIYLAYVVVGLNYLVEVLEKMPKYARDSGQARPGTRTGGRRVVPARARRRDLA